MVAAVAAPIPAVTTPRPRLQLRNSGSGSVEDEPVVVRRPVVRRPPHSPAGVPRSTYDLPTFACSPDRAGGAPSAHGLTACPGVEETVEFLSRLHARGRSSPPSVSANKTMAIKPPLAQAPSSCDHDASPGNQSSICRRKNGRSSSGGSGSSGRIIGCRSSSVSSHGSSSSSVSSKESKRRSRSCGQGDIEGKLLPYGWRRWYSTRQQRHYYEDETTGEVRWARPRHAASLRAASTGAAAKAKTPSTTTDEGILATTVVASGACEGGVEGALVEEEGEE